MSNPSYSSHSFVYLDRLSSKREEIVRGEGGVSGYNFSTHKLRIIITPFGLCLPHKQQSNSSSLTRLHNEIDDSSPASVSSEIISPKTQPGIIAQAAQVVATNDRGGGRRRTAGVRTGGGRQGFGPAAGQGIAGLCCCRGCRNLRPRRMDPIG